MVSVKNGFEVLENRRKLHLQTPLPFIPGRSAALHKGCGLYPFGSKIGRGKDQKRQCMVVIMRKIDRKAMVKGWAGKLKRSVMLGTSQT